MKKFKSRENTQNASMWAGILTCDPSYCRNYIAQVMLPTSVNLRESQYSVHLVRDGSHSRCVDSVWVKNKDHFFFTIFSLIADKKFIAKWIFMDNFPCFFFRFRQSFLSFFFPLLSSTEDKERPEPRPDWFNRQRDSKPL